MSFALLFVLIVLLWIAPIYVAYGIMADKGRSPGAGIGLGLLLGWVGVLIAACLSVDPYGQGSAR